MKKINLSLFALFYVIILSAQETIPATGGNISSNDGSISYSIGQVTYSAHFGAEGSVTEGVQQPYEISIVTGHEHKKSFKLNCNIYPNPTKDLLTLEIKNYNNHQLSYQLYDNKGIILHTKNVLISKTSIDLQNLVPACYFLKILHKQDEVIVFKINKH